MCRLKKEDNIEDEENCIVRSVIVLTMSGVTL
jgi:hypothetical protein